MRISSTNKLSPLQLVSFIRTQGNRVLPFIKKSLYILCMTAAFLSGEEYSLEESSSAPANDPIQIELISEDTTIQPGHSFWLALRFKMDETWHTYWKNPGDVGAPNEVNWVLPEGYTVSDVHWPYPNKWELSGFTGFGYEGETILLVEVTPPANPSTSTAAIEANVRWLVCSDLSCLPGETTLSLQLPISEKTPIADNAQAALFSNARKQLPLQADAKVEANRELIEIETYSTAEIQDAYFCPADKNMIDIKTEAVVSVLDSKTGLYHIVLKESNNGRPGTLKGVLVTKTADGIKAIEIESSLPRAPGVIGMTNQPTNNLEDPQPSPTDFDGGITLALLFAFVGGMILNLMPCVLPVISFKVLSFVKMAGQSRALVLKHGVAFAAGVLISFWVLAGLMLGLQSYGHSVGWGFQLQEPIFVGALAALLLLFGLSLFGVFEMGTSVTAWAGQAGSRSSSKGLVSSFLSGILATAVATPCTGPFLGSAIGFAVTLPTFWALLIFTSLGLGMAFPYLLLAAFPSLLRFMPKPGNWMNTFKEVLGFVMLATVLWLVWVFGAQTNTLSLFLLLSSFFVLAIGAWIYGRWGSVANKKPVRIVSTCLAAICLGIAGYAIVLSTSSELLAIEETSSASNGEWETFSPERVAELQATGTPILIDFTAKWCLICQANHIVLSTNQVEEAMAAKGVVKMKADWTKNDPIITEALKKFGRNGVPLYVLYSGDPNVEPAVLPQVLTPDIVVGHIDQLEAPVAIR